MIPLPFEYACGSRLVEASDGAQLVLCANRRRKTRMCARVRADALPLRLALASLGELLWSGATARAPGDEGGTILDALVTVHPDCLMFEAFAPDASCLAMVIAQRGCFETSEPMELGTTTVPFPPSLRALLNPMPATRGLLLCLDAEGGADDVEPEGERCSGKVELREDWLRDLMRLEASLPRLRTHVQVRPVELVGVLEHVRRLAGQGPPRALRFELAPEREARVVVEPWEQGLALRHAGGGIGCARTVRTWGRDRLLVLERLVPMAERVDVHVGDDGEPSVVVVRMGGVSFVLCLAGWTGTDPRPSGWHSMRQAVPVAAEWVSAVHATLVRMRTRTAEQAGADVGVEPGVAARALMRLCCAGRAVFDPERGEFRHRELLEAPLDDVRLFSVDPMWESAGAWVAGRGLAVWEREELEVLERRRVRGPAGVAACDVVRRELELAGGTPEGMRVRVRMDDEGRLVSGRCSCDFFQENLMRRGPCVHMLALVLAHEGTTPQSASV